MYRLGSKLLLIARQTTRRSWIPSEIPGHRNSADFHHGLLTTGARLPASRPRNLVDADVMRLPLHDYLSIIRPTNQRCQVLRVFTTNRSAQLTRSVIVRVTHRGHITALDVGCAATGISPLVHRVKTRAATTLPHRTGAVDSVRNCGISGCNVRPLAFCETISCRSVSCPTLRMFWMLSVPNPTRVSNGWYFDFRGIPLSLWKGPSQRWS